ncbi:MAG: hypothetical protein J7J87_02940 [Candidatus Diapherotrites archaeon]|nr:hypothetical protein [Candidatus Diapherotrites archaeon]
MKKKLYENRAVREFVEKWAGKEAVEVLKYFLKSKKPVRDEVIAEKTGMRVTEVRTILNRLHYRGIANYDKKRDDKTGWYTYTWKIDTKKIVELILEEEQELLEKLEKEREVQENYTLFTCEGGCVEFPFEIAAEYQFKCPECGRDMNCIDSTTKKRHLSKQINKVRKIIEELKMLK